jgi:hypothetical protein
MTNLRAGFSAWVNLAAWVEMGGVVYSAGRKDGDHGDAGAGASTRFRVSFLLSLAGSGLKSLCRRYRLCYRLKRFKRHGSTRWSAMPRTPGLKEG